MNQKDTKNRLQAMSADNPMAGMLLALIDRCEPNMQEHLLNQVAQSLDVADALSDRIKNDPEFINQMARRKQGG